MIKQKRIKPPNSFWPV